MYIEIFKGRMRDVRCGGASYILVNPPPASCMALQPLPQFSAANRLFYTRVVPPANLHT